MNRKSIALVLLLAGMAVLCVLAVHIDERNVSFCLGKYDRLAVRIRTNAYEEVINSIYRYEDDQDDSYYYFMPFSREDRVIYNDGLDTPLFIDGRELKPFESFEWEEGRIYRVAYDNIHGHQELDVKFMTTAEIPSVFIDTESQNMAIVDESKENVENGTIRVYKADGSVSYSGKLTIQGRGNSTYYSFSKKAYKIKLDKAGCILGMERARDWNLLSNSWDYSYMNNKLALDMSSGAGFSYVPEAEYADMYFNGVYWGLYLVTEKVEVGKNRLNITDLQNLNQRANPGTDIATAKAFEDDSRKGVLLENVPSDITGGYLLERDYRFQKDYTGMTKVVASSFETKDFRTPVRIRSPKYADVKEVEYISGLINEMEQAIRSKDGVSETGKNWQEYIDLDSWVKWYMVSEIAHDSDKGRTSTYFYKDADRVDSKIHMGPVWDFDHEFGGTWDYIAPDVLTKLSPESWIQDLYDRPEFFEAVCREWNLYFRNYLENEAPKKINEWESLIRKSVQADTLRWWKGKRSGKAWPQIGGGMTEDYVFSDEVNCLRWWLNTRFEFLDALWGVSD